jgi:purine-binding chemotaxis protein CheW
MVHDAPIGLIVDHVTEVLTIADDDIVPTPDIYNNPDCNYLKGIGKVGSEIKLILDCDRLFKTEDIDLLN